MLITEIINTEDCAGFHHKELNVKEMLKEVALGCRVTVFSCVLCNTRCFKRSGICVKLENITKLRRCYEILVDPRYHAFIAIMAIHSCSASASKGWSDKHGTAVCQYCDLL